MDRFLKILLVLTALSSFNAYAHVCGSCGAEIATDKKSYKYISIDVPEGAMGYYLWSNWDWQSGWGAHDWKVLKIENGTLYLHDTMECMPLAYRSRESGFLLYQRWADKVGKGKELGNPSSSYLHLFPEDEAHRFSKQAKDYYWEEEYAAGRGDSSHYPVGRHKVYQVGRPLPLQVHNRKSY